MVSRRSTPLRHRAVGCVLVLLAVTAGASPARAEVRTFTVGPTTSPPVALDSGDIVGVEGRAGGAPLRLFAKPAGRADVQVRELAPLAQSAGVIALPGGRAVIASNEAGTAQLRTRRADGAVVPDTVRDAEGVALGRDELLGVVTTFAVATSPDGRCIVLRLDGAAQERLLIRCAEGDWRAVPAPPGSFARSRLVVTDTGRLVLAGATDAGIVGLVLPPGGAWRAAQTIQPLAGFSTASYFLDDLTALALPDGAVAVAWSGRQSASRHDVAAAEIPADEEAFTAPVAITAAQDETVLRMASDAASALLLGVATGPARMPAKHDLFAGRPARGMDLSVPGAAIVRVEAPGDVILRIDGPGREVVVRSLRGPGGTLELLRPGAAFPGVERVLADGTLAASAEVADADLGTTGLRVDRRPRSGGVVSERLGCGLEPGGRLEAAGTRLGILLRPWVGAPVLALTTRATGAWRLIGLRPSVGYPELVLAHTGDAVIGSGDASATQLVLVTGSPADGRPLGPGLGCMTPQPVVVLGAVPTPAGDVRVDLGCNAIGGCTGVLAVTLPPLGVPLGARPFRLRPGARTVMVLRMPALVRPRIRTGGLVPRVVAVSPTGTVLGSTRVGAVS